MTRILEITNNKAGLKNTSLKSQADIGRLDGNFQEEAGTERYQRPEG
ncbi:MAG: hypothetical protein L6V80_06765 [Bacteroidales bacterium]|nr:MAG: hypothetical protein L6V80_06765 [Bacteroidales bacterium]